MWLKAKPGMMALPEAWQPRKSEFTKKKESGEKNTFFGRTFSKFRPTTLPYVRFFRVLLTVDRYVKKTTI